MIKIKPIEKSNRKLLKILEKVKCLSNRGLIGASFENKGLLTLNFLRDIYAACLKDNLTDTPIRVVIWDDDKYPTQELNIWSITELIIDIYPETNVTINSQIRIVYQDELLNESTDLISLLQMENPSGWIIKSHGPLSSIQLNEITTEDLKLVFNVIMGNKKFNYCGPNTCLLVEITAPLDILTTFYLSSVNDFLNFYHQYCGVVKDQQSVLIKEL